jgi:ammonium transporter, Amt family
VKARFGYDDSLDAFGIHGAGGTLGALLTGVFASSAVNPIFKDAGGRVLASGALEGNTHQFVNQAIGVAIATALAVVGTLSILKIVDVVIGLRVPEHHEIEGLDLSQHGEEGYDWEDPGPVPAAAFSQVAAHNSGLARRDPQAVMGD